MGRLENIIARNTPGNRPRERVVVSLVFGGIVLLILALMVFTDLGKSPEPTPRPVPAGDHPRGPHVDGVLLRKQPATRPGAPAPASVTIPAARP